MMVNLSKVAKNLGLLMSLVGAASPAAAAHWGDFRNDGCIEIGNGKTARVYQSVLWDIPPGHSWEVACSKQPADVAGVHFDRPTACAKSSIAATLGGIGTLIGGTGLVAGNPVVSGVGAVVGVSTAILNLAGGGALNMWGVFFVSGQCPFGIYTGTNGLPKKVCSGSHDRRECQELDKAVYCKGYANEAVADEEFNRAHGCVSGWQVNSNGAHYASCMSKSAKEVLQQANNRTQMLKACR